jgi:hypothetical protein
MLCVYAVSPSQSRQRFLHNLKNAGTIKSDVCAGIPTRKIYNVMVSQTSPPTPQLQRDLMSVTIIVSFSNFLHRLHRNTTRERVSIRAY